LKNKIAEKAREIYEKPSEQRRKAVTFTMEREECKQEICVREGKRRNESDKTEAFFSSYKMAWASASLYADGKFLLFLHQILKSAYTFCAFLAETI
jgi:hypothetical protein